MRNLFKTETIVAILFAISIIAIAVFEFCPRQVVIDGTSKDWFTQSETDEVADGNSVGVDVSGQSQLGFQYELGDAITYPYSLLMISSDKKHKLEMLEEYRASGNEAKDWRYVPIEKRRLLDLSWMERVHIVGRVEGKNKETFKMDLVSRISDHHDSRYPVPRGLAQGLFTLTDKTQELVFSRSQFNVPLWWLENFDVDLNRHANPKFDMVEWIQFSPGRQAIGEPGMLVIESIKFSGHYLSSDVFYASLLSMWMLVGMGVIIKFGLHRERQVNMLQSEVKQANFDSLTGLLSRRAFSKMSLEFDASNPKDSEITVILMDIDNFKVINDTKGHNFGDEILARVGKVISTYCDGKNIKAIRWGGEEFLLIAGKMGQQLAAEHADAIRVLMQEEASVTCSFGVYEMKEQGNLLDAIDKADRALYSSKHLGRNRVTNFSDVPVSSAPKILINSHI